MNVLEFEELREEFLERVCHAIYCTMATVDRQNRPRSLLWFATHHTVAG